MGSNKARTNRARNDGCRSKEPAIEIDKLQIELRPRSNAQALDLGFALLRVHAGAAYLVFFALWTPVIAASLVLTWFLPTHGWAWIMLAWWCKPLIERAPLYVLSRQVFGTDVTWQEAVRAWPRQLGGGAFRLLTWGRLFAAGRALHQPVWQLENARGKVAAARMKVLGRDGTGTAAFWFGIVCAHLEAVLQLGAFGLVGIFISDTRVTNPLALLLNVANGDTRWIEMLGVVFYGLCAGLIAPVYTACGFTLYLNRRATLEAWDLEIKLRQMTRPAGARSRSAAAPVLVPVLAPVLGTALMLALLLPAAMLAPPVLAAAPAATAVATAAPAARLDERCKAPEWLQKQRLQYGRGADQGAEQARVRAAIDAIYGSEDLRGYKCEETWQPRVKPRKDTKDPDKLNMPKLEMLAAIFKVLLIAAAIGAAVWLLVRYRDKLPRFARSRARVAATEIGGLDIRAESLPDDVTAGVRALWSAGRHRAALALLYRATLSRLVSGHALALRQGDTEGDCLRLCREACLQGRLDQGRLAIATAATTLWLGGAYGERWPLDAEVAARCAEWDAQFGPGRSSGGMDANA